MKKYIRVILVIALWSVLIGFVINNVEKQIEKANKMLLECLGKNQYYEIKKLGVFDDLYPDDIISSTCSSNVEIEKNNFLISINIDDLGNIEVLLTKNNKKYYLTTLDKSYDIYNYPELEIIKEADPKLKVERTSKERVIEKPTEEKPEIELETEKATLFFNLYCYKETYKNYKYFEVYKNTNGYYIDNSETVFSTSKELIKKIENNNKYTCMVSMDDVIDESFLAYLKTVLVKEVKLDDEYPYDLFDNELIIFYKEEANSTLSKTKAQVCSHFIDIYTNIYNNIGFIDEYNITKVSLIPYQESTELATAKINVSTIKSINWDNIDNLDKYITNWDTDYEDL